MVEGHGVHRVANRHQKRLKGQRFRASSPNGRFTAGAAAIDGKLLYRIEAIGKNLFYFFADNDNDVVDSTVVVHIHFGMSGRFATYPATPKMAIPETKLTTRLVLSNDKTVSHLSAMTCKHGDISLFEAKQSALGPDPLRADADSERFLRLCRAQRGRKMAIGAVLMDQTKIAGVGNIYRAEVCFKARVHPDQAVGALERPDLERVWHHSVDLMRRGFRQGSILTVDETDKRKFEAGRTRRRYVYNQRSCLVCGSAIVAWKIKGRTAFACTTCQPKRNDGATSRETHAHQPAKLFPSVCAPDSDACKRQAPAKMTVRELRARLRRLGARTTGRKAALVARLVATGALARGPGSESVVADSKSRGLSFRSRKRRRGGIKTGTPGVKAGTPGVKTGTPGVKDEPVASALDAALEKVRAGENASVEHVALADEHTLALETRRKRRRANGSRS